ncbi:MAG TPA: radical SAM family heme chaperone HemW [Humidesulfovibrio sp.]|uniref:radical SAM family heme chaperone HemW n=1 Tax=Humidesulfovibrio sp. TaxID=2910988 RepID=UPI002BE33064|nr:radical SAM family heme chaperone HemW [Humidesulfovibrio sp.]HWR04039.1 radical SAM family heme chaperone HemW [Humidesulfovibrio sp.]
MSTRASLYVHAPFCRAKCRYCAFFSAPTGSAGPDAPALSRYLSALEAEMNRQAQIFGRVAAPTLFFGGGTPSLLGANALARILAALRQRFDLAPDAEITLEANPDSAAPELLRAARELGVNRLSLGVQSLDDAALKALGRVHTAAQVREAFHAARAAGFANIGLDLIFGLPGQSVEGWLSTLRQAVDLRPEHLSCYGLTIEPGTPLAEDATALAALPDEDCQAEMFLRGSELLEAAGYEHYEISNFAKLSGGVGQRCRHNMSCWRGEDVLAFGPAAVSTMAEETERVRWANPPDLAEWEALVLEGRAGQAGCEALSADIRASEALMLALRTADGLDLNTYAATFGHDLRNTHADLLIQLERAGLTLLDEGRLRLTRAGMLVSNSVIRALGFEFQEISANPENSS